MTKQEARLLKELERQARQDDLRRALLTAPRSHNCLTRQKCGGGYRVVRRGYNYDGA